MKCAKSFMSDHPSFFTSGYAKELEVLKYKSGNRDVARLEAQDRFAQNEKKESQRARVNPSDTLIHMFGNNDEVLND
jgi:hypothetical protein